jgi:two-component system sensor histidine kinase EvgS
MANISLILTAENDPHRPLAQQFRQEGYLVVEAFSGREAVLLAEKIHPDLILMTADLPQLSGLDACYQIRQNFPTPIVMGVDSEESAQQALQAGASICLILPDELPELSGIVRRTLPKKVSSAEYRRTTTLTDEHRLLRTLIDNLPDYIFAKDTEGRFIISNLANAQYLGVENPDDLIGKTDYDFFPPERANIFREDEKAIMSSRRPMLNQEISVYYPDSDSTRWYSITKVPLLDVHDEIIGIVGLIRDITRRKEGEQRMKEANAKLAELNNLKSHFLLSISHELRTPLNSILGYSEMLLQELLGPLNDTQRDRLGRVAHNGRSLLRLIENVLDISSIQTGTLELQIGDVPVDGLVAELFTEYKPQADAKGLMLVKDVEAGLPPLRSDARAIYKILDNLLSNGIKFTESGYVVLGVQRIPAFITHSLPVPVQGHDQDWIMIYVQDTGIGISAEIKYRLFDEFRQADNSTTRERGGIGLGLALCKKLVDLMGGYIWMESAPGYGSTFFVLLPITG